MKLPPDEEFLNHIKGSIRQYIDIYTKVFNDLRRIGIQSKDHGFTFRITSDPELSFHFGWETLAPGFWITFSDESGRRGTLLALPPSPMRTDTYGPYYFGGTPPAAGIIKVSPGMVLFLSQENPPPDEMLTRIVQQRESIQDVIPMASTWKIGSMLEVEVNDPACVDIPASPGNQEIIDEAIRWDPELSMIGICTSGWPIKELFSKNKANISLEKFLP